MLLVLTRVKYYYGFQIRILHLSQLESLQAEHQILNINHSLKQRGVTAKARWLPVLVLAFQLTSCKRQKWGQGEALRALWYAEHEQIGPRGLKEWQLVTGVQPTERRDAPSPINWNEEESGS